MINDNLNISSIETYLDKIIKGKVSKTVFAGTLPNTISDDTKDLVLIDVVNVNDLDGYGKGMVNIFLYAKPTANGRKNVAQLQKMEKAMNVLLESIDNEAYSFTRAYPAQQDYDTALNWHFTIVALNIIIK